VIAGVQSGTGHRCPRADKLCGVRQPEPSTPLRESESVSALLAAVASHDADAMPYGISEIQEIADPVDPKLRHGAGNET
jgi:hypothetical protein